MAKETRDARITIRMPTALRARLEELAEADGRSIANLIVQVLRRHVEAAVTTTPNRKGR